MKKWLIGICSVFLLFFWAGIPNASAASSKFIIINKSSNKLAYYENSQLKRVFKVGTGRSQSLTPEGKFRIVQKIVNRPYYTGNIPGGDPRNPLGNRWMGFNARGTSGSTYGIHGNNNPASIGGYVSSGCVRMYDNEVEWLFEQVPIHTAVIITSSGKSFDAIAKAYGYSTKPGGNPDYAGVTLKKGSQGEAVAQLQRKLTSSGFSPGGIDGIFGSATDRAVRAFQKSRGLTVDGIAGPATWSALNKSAPPQSGSSLMNSGLLKRGSKGAAVKELQQRLTAKGYSTRGADGIFGPNTEKAVKAFQKARGLAVDGLVGPATKRSLLK
ncbi:L,D-transpeptidase family protein [Bacillus mangrovi]|uniref:L,D-transpeptidase family protein n=1 Tax=Metabacillus mangrovi TaxID=1491830 RepID=A0A7X2S7P4_9BACI|nr:L,D-transpeptidase family protein [Metabacillus mangrovi]